MGAFNPDKLEALSTQMLGYVDRGQAAGIVTGLWRKGEWHIDAIGLQDLRTKEPMRPDSIFRIASMSKPIVAVAALMLVEEGILALDDAIDRWLPEVREMQVLRSLASPLTDTVPLARPITVRDLLTFTLGTGFVLAPPGTYPIQQAIADAGMQPGPRPPAAAPDLRQPPAGLPTRRKVALPHRLKRAQRADRASGGRLARCLSRAAHLRPTRHEGHRLLCQPGQSGKDGPLHHLLPSAPRRQP
jgi:CubicO group peptidase (beta-lactamase class C family)